MVCFSFTIFDSEALRLLIRHSFYLIFFSCGIKAQASAAVDAITQTLTIALSQEPPQLDSTKATDQVSGFVLGHLMEGLVRYDKRGNIIPGVAEKWEMDKKTATFWLREDAKWSNGEPVTAHDFVFAWRRVVDPKTASEYAFIFAPIKNAIEINEGRRLVSELGVVALDDRTLQVTLERPTAFFIKLGVFVTFFPIQENFFKSREGKYAAEAKDLIYNGPFKLTNWVHSASLKMVKNNYYWDRKKVFLNAINVKYITADTRSRLNLYADSKIAFTRLDGETYKDALSHRFKIRRFNTGATFFLEYNHRAGRPTQNLNLRKAIQHVFDADEMVNRVLATPGNLRGESLFPVWIDGVNGKFRQEYPAPLAEYSVEKANEYLASAVDEIGQVPPLILLVGDSPTAIKQGEYLQGVLLDKLGIELKIDVQTFKQRLAKMTSGNFDIVSAGWGPDFDDILTFGDLFASWNMNNRGRYNNSEYDRLVRLTMSSTDQKTRMDAMGKAQQILFNDAVILPQYEQGIIYLLHPKVKGVARRVIGTDPDFTYSKILP